MPPWKITVYENQQPVYVAVLDGIVELGRQNDQDEKPYAHQRDDDRWRIAIARLDERVMSRKHVLAEPLPGGRIRLSNLSTKASVRLEHGPDLKPASSLDATLPVVLVLDKRTIRFQEPAEEDVPLEHLPEVTFAPGVNREGVASRLGTVRLTGSALGVEGLVHWMRVTMDVLQSAVSSLEFFSRAARAVVDLVGLDSGQVLLLEGDAWKPQVLERRKHTRDHGEPPSRHVLNRVREEKRTFWRVPVVTNTQDSLVGVNAVVAAPILNRHGDVIGALYGDRRRLSGAAQPLSQLEAMLVELLASGVAAGLARVEMERAMVRARVQFEQFFTPELSRELEVNPGLLEGRDLDVTVLFCDIRRFSQISGQLDPASTIKWINDILGALSRCVLDQGGVLVDYVGDELMAMWGAPQDQPDHARRACRAALAMLEQLPKFQERWLPVIQVPMDLGIGINSGPARVGNVGSEHKFKYGPHGNTVNLASRVQGATKHLKTQLVLTETTQQQLGVGFATRRLCAARLVHIERPVMLYELVGPEPRSWPQLKRDYERALELYERQEFQEASQLLGNLRLAHPGDGPSLILLARVIDCLVREVTGFDPVWEMKSK